MLMQSVSRGVQMTLWIICMTLSVCANASADEAVRTWADITGKHKREGTFLKLEGGVVLLRLADGTVARIPIKKLSQGDQSYATTASTVTEGEPDPFNVEQASRAAKQLDKAPESAAGFLAGTDDEPLRVVVVEGVGTDVESAKADAYRQAVRQVVGAFVDASTMVSNDQLIEDRVITLSSAFVEKVEPVAESKSGGLVRTRVRAHVRVTKLLDTLNANRIATSSVDAESLVAQVVTKAGQQEGFEAIFAKHLPNFHEHCFGVALVGQPTAGKVKGDSVEVKVRVRLSANKAAFLALSQKIAAALDATPRKHGEIVSDGLKAANNNEYHSVVANIRSHILNNTNWGDLIEIFADNTELTAVEKSADREGNSPLIKYEPLFLISDPTCTGDTRPCGISGLRYEKLEKLYREDGTAILILLTKANESFQRTQWRWFHLSKDEADLLLKHLPKIFRCTVKLFDQHGDEIARDVLRLSKFGFWQPDNPPIIAMSPFFVDEDIEFYTPTVTLERTLTLEKSEVGSLGKAEVALVEETEP